ncbi:MAG TPA: SsrA-binding protein SmpB [Aestuariivirgaceae bacterium]|nr:SsrA-binding protein SmpB [Aestuariivirgaceae bacterium]
MVREPFSARQGPARPKPGRTDEKQRKLIADNRRARFDYEIIDTYEAGIQLQGPEVKSLRAGRSSLSDSYATVERGELFLINAYIPEYREANRFNHETRRPRKLLLHRREIEKLANAVQREGLTIVPLKLFFNPRGRAKVDLALARGKRAHDKREAQKERSWQRDRQRLLRDRG